MGRDLSRAPRFSHAGCRKKVLLRRSAHRARRLGQRRKSRVELAHRAGVQYAEPNPTASGGRVRFLQFEFTARLTDSPDRRSRKLGSNSFSSATLFAPSGVVSVLMPVILPPGRLRLATRPRRTVAAPENTIETVEVAAWRRGRKAAHRRRAEATRNPTSPRQGRQSVVIAFGPSERERQILSFDEACSRSPSRNDATTPADRPATGC